MSKDPKTRFFATVDGKRAELFSAMQRANGDLIVSPRRNLYFEIPGVIDNEKIKHEKISVHRSLNTQGHTITGTIAFESGKSIRHVAYVAPGSSPFMWHLFSKRFSYLADNTFLLSERYHDKLIEVARFSADVNNLVLHVFVAEVGVSSACRSIAGYQRYFAIFDHFEVFALPAFMPGSSFDQGDTFISLTSGVKYGDNTFVEVDRHDGVSWPLATLPAEIRQVEKRIGKRARERILRASEIAGGGEWRSEVGLKTLFALTSTFSPRPFGAGIAYLGDRGES